jgi:hypothetical protein
MAASRQIPVAAHGPCHHETDDRKVLKLLLTKPRAMSNITDLHEVAIAVILYTEIIGEFQMSAKMARTFLPIRYIREFRHWQNAGHVISSPSWSGAMDVVGAQA